MKYYFLLVLLYSIIYVHADNFDENCLIGQTFSEEDCFKKTELPSHYCCVLNYKKDGSSNRVCNIVSVENYRDLNPYKEFLIGKGLSDISFKCESDSVSKPESESRSKSKYLQLGIISLLILIITL